MIAADISVQPCYISAANVANSATFPLGQVGIELDAVFSLGLLEDFRVAFQIVVKQFAQGHRLALLLLIVLRVVAVKHVCGHLYTIFAGLLHGHFRIRTASVADRPAINTAVTVERLCAGGG